MDTSKIIKDPGMFKDRYTFDEWWKATKLYIRFQKSLTDDQKILAVLSRMMEGSGRHWASNKLDALAVDNEDITWLGFSDDIATRFSIANKSVAAKARLEVLKQEKRTVDEFLDEFEELLKLSNLGKETGKYILEKNVNRRISEQVASDGKTYTDYAKEIRNKGRQMKGHALVIRGGGDGTMVSNLHRTHQRN